MTALDVINSEARELVFRYRAARFLDFPHMMAAHAMALRSLNRVRRELRSDHDTQEVQHALVAADVALAKASGEVA